MAAWCLQCRSENCSLLCTAYSMFVHFFSKLLRRPWPGWLRHYTGLEFKASWDDCFCNLGVHKEKERNLESQSSCLCYDHQYDHTSNSNTVMFNESKSTWWSNDLRWAASSNQTKPLSGFVPSVVLNSLAGWRKRDKTSVCKNRIRAWSEKFLHDLHPDFSRAKQTQTVCWTLPHIQSSTYTLHTK